MKAPQQLTEWAREFEGILEKVADSEKMLKKIIDNEIQEGNEVIKEEQEEIKLTNNVIGDLDVIQEALQDIQSNIEKDVKFLNNPEKEATLESKFRTITHNFDHNIVPDIKEIKEEISEIAKDIHYVKKENMEELKELDTEVTEYETTYELLVQADNHIAKIDEMANSLENTAQAGGDQELLRIANAVENSRQNIEQRLSELEKEESQVGREIAEEENLVMKELDLDESELSELKQEITEEKQILNELAKLETAVDEHGGHDLAKHLDKARKQMEGIEKEMEKIVGVVNEIERIVQQEAQDMDETNPSS
jgi:DNA repair exonuclease SbcCD ATPase subunit